MEQRKIKSREYRRKYKVQSGDRYNQLTIIKELPSVLNPKTNCIERMVLYRCDCGNTESGKLIYLIKGQRKHCTDRGNHPVHIERIEGLRNVKNMRLYRIWSNIKNRCYNKNNHNYHCYGERGIYVCEEWLKNFKAFYDWSISNGYNENLTIDRIDNNGNYEPSNCRWITQKEQCQNRRGLITIDVCGNKMSLTKFCELMGLPYHKIYNKMKEMLKNSKAE